VPNSVGSKVLNCNDNAGRQECSFAAGGGSYVDPNSQVIVYGTRYDEDFYVGQPGFTDCNAGLTPDGTPFNFVAGRTTTNNVPCYPGTLHAKEFHERHGNLAIGTSCPTLDDAWVEFYSLGFFNDYGSDGSGQIRYVDYLSRLSQNPYFGANDFADKAQSVRWCLPPGAGYEVFQGNQSGPYAVLNGTGTVAEIADLNVPGITLSDGAIANQRISSGIFVGSGDPVNGWNGVPDTGN
jgi:hypothetical protein